MKWTISLGILCILVGYIGRAWYVEDITWRPTERCVAWSAVADSDVPPNFHPWCDTVATFTRFAREVPHTRLPWTTFDSLRRATP
jgi:hypothetical protein